MRYSKESVAYDYELFAPRSPKTEQKIVALPAKKARAAARPAAKAQARPKSFTTSAGKILLAGVIVAMLCMMLFTRMRITEHQSEIARATTQLEELKAEEVRLSMELENKTSFENVEQLAQAMGMQKAQPYQIHYVSYASGDRAEVLEDDKSNVLSILSDLIRRVVE